MIVNEGFLHLSDFILYTNSNPKSGNIFWFFNVSPTFNFKRQIEIANRGTGYNV